MSLQAPGSSSKSAQRIPDALDHPLVDIDQPHSTRLRKREIRPPLSSISSAQSRLTSSFRLFMRFSFLSSRRRTIMTKLRTILLALAFALAALTQTAQAQSFYHFGAAGPYTTFGWNFGHVSGCMTYFDGSTTWFYVYAQEGGFGVTNNPYMISSLAPACQNGRAFAVNVTSINPFQWNMIYIYPN
jgi:hypothetical protein